MMLRPQFVRSRSQLNFQGLKVSYWDEGQGFPLILIHGLGGSVEHWAWTIPHWTAKYRVVAIDLPGAGQSEIPSIDTNLRELTLGAQLVQRFIEQLDLNKPVIVGHSLGGGIAVQHALSFPGQQRGMVLISSMGFGLRIDLLTKLLAIPGLGHLVFQPTRTAIRQLIASAPVDEDLDEIVEITYRYLKRPGAKNWLLSLLQQGVNFAGQVNRFLPTELARINVPTQVIWGNSDPMFPISHGENARQWIPNAQLTVFNSVRHNPHIERPEAVAAIVTRLVETIEVDRIGQSWL
jgi:4,5:9,10-diseco-3-hydroxy-5,9,17-trioxoandrosta-1(10),2-diene-4-oate hydrolase